MSVARKRGKRSPKDFYRTPVWCCGAIAEHVYQGFWDSVIDIGAGDGRVGTIVSERCDAYSKAFVEVRGIDESLHVPVERVFVEPNPDGLISGRLIKKTFEESVDELSDLITIRKKSIVVGNPPYYCLDTILESVHQMLEISMHSQLWFLLRLDYLGSKIRYRLMSCYQPDAILTLVPRPKFENGGNDSGDYAWIGWNCEKVIKPVCRDDFKRYEAVYRQWL